MEEPDFKDRILGWLRAIEEESAAELLNECELRMIFVDLGLGQGRELTICDVNVETPPKYYIKLGSFNDLTKKIEDTIHELSFTDDVHVRDIHWVPGMGKPESSERIKNSEEISEMLNEGYVKQQLALMHQSLYTAPHITIGIAKELLETTCKTILKAKNIEVDKNWNIGRIIKETNKSLKLMPDELKDKDEAERSILKILSGFSSVVQGVTELRNYFGSGHGHESDFQSLDVIYAKLIADASSDLSFFYLKIHKQNNRSRS